MILDATLTSVWDGGSTTITTGCKVNTETREVFDIEVSDDADYVDVLDEEYVTISGVMVPAVQKDNFDDDDEDCEYTYWYE